MRKRPTNPERIYAAAWHRYNRKHFAVNNGYRALELILHPECTGPVPPASRRDATVAACVIQWLGTSCGLAFIAACEREIEASLQRDSDRQTLERLREQWRKLAVRTDTELLRVPRGIALGGS